MRIAVGSETVEIDTVVFDLFHTLADPQEQAPPGFRRLEKVAAILGMAESDIDLWWEQNVPVFVSEPVSPVDELVELARVRRIVVSPGHVAELDRAMGMYQDRALHSPVAGAVATLRALRDRDVATAILSNAHVRDVRAFLESPLSAAVDDACFSCFTGMVKPDPEAYLGVLERLGADPGRSAFVGDGGSGELEGARRAGYAAAIAVIGPVGRGGWRPSDEQSRIEADADLVIADVSDLLGLERR